MTLGECLASLRFIRVQVKCTYMYRLVQPCTLMYTYVHMNSISSYEPEKLTVAEFRKQMKTALDYCVQGGVIEIDRMGQRFLITSIGRDMDIIIGKSEGKFKLGTDPKKVNHLAPAKKNEPVATPPNEFAEALDASEQECCRKKAPCRHWQFQDGFWVNSLSGRSREVDNG